MTTTPVHALSPAQSRRRIALGLLRAVIVAGALVALYYVAPLDRIVGAPLELSLAVALLVLLAVTILQVRAILRSVYPGIRAAEALAATVPLFLLLYAATYYILSQADPANFNAHALNRSDALYFTVTVFTTVGFGDITATSESARLLVTTQMIADLLVLGLGIRVFIGAVQIAHQHQTPNEDTTDHP